MEKFKLFLPFLILGLFCLVVVTDVKAQSLLSFFPQTEKCTPNNKATAINESALETAEDSKLAWFGINLFVNKYKHQQMRSPKKGAAKKQEPKPKTENRSYIKDYNNASNSRKFADDVKPKPLNKSKEVKDKIIFGQAPNDIHLNY